MIENKVIINPEPAAVTTLVILFCGGRGRELESHQAHHFSGMKSPKHKRL